MLYCQFGRRTGRARQLDGLHVFHITACALSPWTAGMEWDPLPCFGGILKTVPASLRAQARLGKQAVYKEAYEEKLDKKYPE